MAACQWTYKPKRDRLDSSLLQLPIMTTNMPGMPYARLGSSGLKVSKIILGCMSYGSSEWLPWVLDEEESIKHIKFAYDAGINTFDTANMYSNGLSEVVLGKAIKQHNLPRDEIVIMTKLYYVVKRDHKTQIPDGETPDKYGYNHYNLVYREEEREMFPTLNHFGVGSIPWSPLARGFVARPISQQTKRSETDDMIPGYAKLESNREIVNRVEEIANRRSIDMAQVSLAWILNRPGVSASVVGSTSINHLTNLIGAVHIKLSEEDMKYLEEPYQPQAINGHY
ncbi:hypothetical protein FRC03_011718 [Tulasnella sp. 419]|nr:hypothetical protein FRC03_011718 [Tulasnella sp. 419]